MSSLIISSYTLNTSNLFITDLRDNTTQTHTIPNFTFRYSSQIALLPDGNLIITGGDNVNEVWRINASEGCTMTPLAPMSAARFQHGSIYFEDFVYALGGFGTPPLETCERYNVNTNTWEALANMPVGVTLTTPCAIQPTKRIYILGGWREFKETSQIQELDLASNTWTLLTVELPHTGLCLTTFKVGETSSQIWFVEKFTLFNFDTRTKEIRKAKDLEDDPCTSGGTTRYYKGQLFCSFSQEKANVHRVGALRWEEIKGVLWALKTKTVLTREVVGWLGY
jgi:hypothetical protein